MVLEPFSKLDNRTVAAPWESALLSSLPAPALVPGCKPPHIREFWFLFFERYIFFERYNLKRRIPEQHAKNHVTSTFLGGAFCSDASVSAKPGMAPPPAPCVWTYENWVWIQFAPMRTSLFSETFCKDNNSAYKLFLWSTSPNYGQCTMASERKRTSTNGSARYVRKVPLQSNKTHPIFCEGSAAQV